MGQIFFNERFRLIDSGENVEVLAIGDSWFHHPLHNLIAPLHGVLERPTIFVLGESGARADELCKDSWFANFERMLADYPSIKFVCISAGGNDFAGVGDLDDKVLEPDCSAASNAEQCFRPGQPDGVFAAVETSYRVLLDAVSAARPGLPVLLHNYDYAIPDGRTLFGMRSWLKLPLDNCRAPTPGAPLSGIRREIVRTLIDKFTLALDTLEAAYAGGAKAQADLVWTAGLLGNSDWSDELHPKQGAFNRLGREGWRAQARRAMGLPD